MLGKRCLSNCQSVTVGGEEQVFGGSLRGVIARPWRELTLTHSCNPHPPGEFAVGLGWRFAAAGWQAGVVKCASE
eukprot:275654-Amphidinium_carterae.1